MKKIFVLFFTFVLTLSLIACGGSKSTQSEEQVVLGDSDIKVGFVLNGDEDDANTYAFYQGVLAMKEELGLTDHQIVVKWNVPVGEKAYSAAVDLADQFCDIVFSNCSGHEEYMIRAAIEYPDVQFCQAGGKQAATSDLKNIHNYYYTVHESRYVSGIVAGLKLNEMIEKEEITPEEAKMGFVGTFSSPDVISGYTSFYLGARSVCDSVTMDVKYTGSWKDKGLETEAVEELITGGCVLISHHTDTNTVAIACEEAGVPIVGYHVSLNEVAPNCALTSASVDWATYLTFAVKSAMDGTEIPFDWSEGYAEGAVKITELNKTSVAKGTEEAVATAEESLKNGSLNVFDTSTWTVGEEQIITTATEEWFDSYQGLEYIKNGAFQESTLRSAPAFSFRIDGITELNEAYILQEPVEK